MRRWTDPQHVTLAKSFNCVNLRNRDVHDLFADPCRTLLLQYNFELFANVLRDLWNGHLHNLLVDPLHAYLWDQPDHLLHCRHEFLHDQRHWDMHNLISDSVFDVLRRQRLNHLHGPPPHLRHKDIHTLRVLVFDAIHRHRPALRHPLLGNRLDHFKPSAPLSCLLHHHWCKEVELESQLYGRKDKALQARRHHRRCNTIQHTCQTKLDVTPSWLKPPWITHNDPSPSPKKWPRTIPGMQVCFAALCLQPSFPARSATTTSARTCRHQALLKRLNVLSKQVFITSDVLDHPSPDLHSSLSSLDCLHLICFCLAESVVSGITPHFLCLFFPAAAAVVERDVFQLLRDGFYTQAARSINLAGNPSVTGQ